MYNKKEGGVAELNREALWTNCMLRIMPLDIADSDWPHRSLWRQRCSVLLQIFTNIYISRALWELVGFGHLTPFGWFVEKTIIRTNVSFPVLASYVFGWHGATMFTTLREHSQVGCDGGLAAPNCESL